ncbi:hypothetical protein [uncultured Helicobacter sp.]|uniref:hypothetical protein n=1 Tax=uncultured Helicobacter sp. TaxID=175537 RepID=UPI00271201CB|nr:hypothetical protein [uncultured Helicobacter sp.]
MRDLLFLRCFDVNRCVVLFAWNESTLHAIQSHTPVSVYPHPQKGFNLTVAKA